MKHRLRTAFVKVLAGIQKEEAGMKSYLLRSSNSWTVASTDMFLFLFLFFKIFEGADK